MKTCTITVKNPSGIHARPASLFVKLAMSFHSKITVEHDGVQYNGKSILNLLAAQLHQGVEICLTTEGEDEDAAMEALTKAINEGLGEGL